MSAPTRSRTVPVAFPVPLYVDLDGTLVAADTTLEGFFAYAKRGVGPTLRLIWWIMRGRALAKSRLARVAPIDAAALPYRPQVLALIREARARGSPVILATASHRRTAQRVAAHLDMFDGVIGSSRRRNLKGAAKLGAIRAHSRAAAFDYVGDSGADIPIWRAAREGTIVGPRSRTGVHAHVLAERASRLNSLVRTMRPHQWAKNILVFVPLLTGWRIDEPGLLSRAGIAFLLFSLTASGVYLLNDSLDIEADRAHPTKRNRPIASGALPLPLALLASLLMLIGPVIVAWLLLGRPFGLALMVYLVTTSAYSFYLKRVMTVDVLVLAFLYTLRLIAGAAAVGSNLSFWLISFSGALFTSLAYLKRYIELSQQGAPGKNLHGRGYSALDTEIVAISGLVAAGIAVLILALFIHDPETRAHYRSPVVLAGLFPILLYWVNRTWLMARRGEVPGDPVAFAIKDWRSRVLGVCALIVLLGARFLSV